MHERARLGAEPILHQVVPGLPGKEIAHLHEPHGIVGVRQRHRDPGAVEPDRHGRDCEPDWHGRRKEPPKGGARFPCRPAARRSSRTAPDGDEVGMGDRHGRLQDGPPVLAAHG